MTLDEKNFANPQWAHKWIVHVHDNQPARCTAIFIGEDSDQLAKQMRAKLYELRTQSLGLPGHQGKHRGYLQSGIAINDSTRFTATVEINDAPFIPIVLKWLDGYHIGYEPVVSYSEQRQWTRDVQKKPAQQDLPFRGNDGNGSGHER